MTFPSPSSALQEAYYRAQIERQRGIQGLGGMGQAAAAFANSMFGDIGKPREEKSTSKKTSFKEELQQETDEWLKEALSNKHH